MSDTKVYAKAARKRANKARNFPTNTCGASRHVAMMADALIKPGRYPMFEEEPEHCAASLFDTVESLWSARSERDRLIKALRELVAYETMIAGNSYGTFDKCGKRVFSDVIWHKADAGHFAMVRRARIALQRQEDREKEFARLMKRRATR